MIHRLLILLLLSSAAAGVCELKFYQVQSRYWSGDRTRDLPLSSDIRSQNSNTQVLQCLMQLSRRWQLGRNECLVFQPGSTSPCFIGSLNAHVCENLQTANSENGAIKIKVLVTYLNRQSDCTVIQNRVSNSTDFNRSSTEYAKGFGEGPSGNFWIGLTSLHDLTKSKPRILYIEWMLWNGSSYWASYSNFMVASAATNYQLTSLGSFTASNPQIGDAVSDCLGRRFSTFDADHDSNREVFCSLKYRGGWWYNSCHVTNPNGFYALPPEALNMPEYMYARGIVWSNPFGYYYSMKKFKMMIL